MHSRSDLCNFVRSILKFCILWLLPVTSSRNIATEHVTYLRDPRISSSQFGYSLVAQQRNDLLTLWVGAPKYSVESQSSSSSNAKQGAVFRCEVLASLKYPLSNQEFSCSALDFKAMENGYKGQNTGERFQNNLTSTPLSMNDCSEENELCGFNLPNKSSNLWKYTKRSEGYVHKKAYKKCYQADSDFRPIASLNRVLITGPPSTNENHFLAFSNQAFEVNSARVSVLVSPPIHTIRGQVQCLRFCFNAFTRIKGSKSSLVVWKQYEDPNIHDHKYQLLNISSSPQEWSLFWNHTEANIDGLYDESYRIYFEATLYSIQSSNKRCKVKKTTAIALSDISVSNLPCEEEESNVDEVTEEQSIGMNIKSKNKENNDMTLASCAPLWQQNCGYAREANGICYELLVNGTHVKELKSIKPLTKKCIRGKIDIVLVVDQSGSVNECNFQKIKRWLRNIVRSFNIGKEEQDIGVVVYSSRVHTSVVVPLGFEHVSDSDKKANTIKVLKNLPYAAGHTFTGFALLKANEELEKARKDSKKIIILLTDGETTKKNQPQLKIQSEIARNRSITILAVGVGNFNEEELKQIAGNPKNVFSVKKFSELEKVRDKLKGFFKLEALEGGNTPSNASDARTQQCQMGFSLHYSQDELLLGSPGCYHMSGNVISYQENRNETIQESSAYVESQDENMSQGTTFNPVAGVGGLDSTTVLTGNAENDEKVSDKDDFTIPTLAELQNEFSRELADSYLGYAVTSGFFFGFNEPQLTAASAPRYKGRGAVFVYQSFKGQPLKERLQIPGQQFGEYFGAVLCADDLNVDGFSDLLVGAPLHIGSQPDEGRVFVYMGARNMSATPDYTLKGDKTAFARFGSYITVAGDLNRDGYNDVAVSAPLEEKGVVYIFYGSRNGIKEKYVQKLSPEKLKPLPLYSLTRFGPTIVGKVDVDKNGYPDLIVGSPDDDAVCILLSRPVVHIDALLLATPEIDARSPECRYSSRLDSACFNCSVCFSYNGISINSDIAVDYSLLVDADQRPPRFGLHKGLSSSISSSIPLPSANITKCENYSFVLKRAIVRDLMTSVRLNLDFHLGTRHNHHIHNSTGSTNDSEAEASGDSNQPHIMYYNNLPINLDEDDDTPPGNLRLDPILDSEDKQSLAEIIHFKTYCNAINKCEADISIEAKLIETTGKQLHEILIGSRKTVQFRVAVINRGPEDAYDVAINMSYPSNLFINRLKKVAIAMEDGKVVSPGSQCFEFDDRKTHPSNLAHKYVTIVLKPTMQKLNQSCTFDVIFGISDTIDPYEDRSFLFKLNSSTISDDHNSSNNKAELQIPVFYEGKLLVDGFPKHQLVWADKNISDDHQTLEKIKRYSSPIKNYFTVTNTGNLALPQLHFIIKWPAYVWINKKQSLDLLYLKNLTCSSSSQEDSCTCGSNELIDSHGLFRYSDEMSSQILSIASFLNISESIEECRDMKSNCYINISCNIQEIPPQTKVNITVESMVFPNIMLNIKKPALLAVDAYVYTDMEYPVNISSPTGLTVKVTNKLIPIRAYDSTVDDTDLFKLPWWVILLSVLAALLLIALLAFLLKKCGFFKSKYADMKKEAQKDPEEATPLNA